MFSEGNRIIVIKTFFATSFSDLFRLEINSKIFAIDLCFNTPFQQLKQLVHVRIRDHITNNSNLDFCVFVVAMYVAGHSNSLEKIACSQKSKNRSPYV